MQDLRLVVAGASGRMGRMLVKAIHDSPGVMVSAALEAEGSLAIGQDAGLLAGLGKIGVLITDDPAKALVKADALIDFTRPAASVEFAKLASQTGTVHVLGTTGLNDEELAKIAAAARKTVIIRSGNMSLGVNLLAAMVEKVARALGPEYDIEILEMHHRQKIDAPSGTALLLGEAAAKGRGQNLAEHSVRVRDGITGPRNSADIGFASLRGGTVIGDHTVIFAGPGERIELVHKAEDRGLFALGALRAAVWGHGKAPGLYGMNDVLGLNQA